MKEKSVGSYLKKARTVVQKEGVLQVLIISLQKLQKSQYKKGSRKFDIMYSSLAATEDIMNLRMGSYKPPKPKGKKPPYTINWVMSPPRGGGGHQNIFRFIDHLDAQGHKNNVYLYSTIDFLTVEQVRQNISSYSKAKNVTIQWLDANGMKPADAVFATGWETAYPVMNAKTDAQKLYFVQDFEPYFYPVGSDYVLAENTYRFGFHGVTAGKWLAGKLNSDYGMTCDSYDFGADPGVYSFKNKGERKKVFFYARPVTTRRGFELGIMTLIKFHELKPDYEIVLAGWDVSEFNIPFPYTNLKALPISALNDVYNECAAALVISLTNMSLLPLELLAAGTIPVVNNGKNNSEVSSLSFIKYAEPTPDSLAYALKETVDRSNLPAYAAKAAESAKLLGWDVSCKKFEEVVERQIHG
ncbi:MAG TPA: glycosyltransferase family 1 protein [Candidatus Saccharimonadia bacterium]|nr:glycosyltransferase family 1 protein [Candidatus Saccharimonadia bacterium]